MEPPNDSARAMYRAGYLAGYEHADAGLPARPDLTDDELTAMLAAWRMVADAARAMRQ
jgi:hypothetical protein